MRSDGARTSDIQAAITNLVSNSKALPKGVSANAFRQQIGTIASIKDFDDTDKVAKAAKAIGCSENAIEQFKSGNLADGILDKASGVSDTAKTMAGQAADAADAGIPDGASAEFGQVPSGFASIGNGKIIPSFQFDKMSSQINDIDNMIKDGVLDESELEKIGKLQDRLASYSKWAQQNANSDNPLIQQKAALVQQLNDKLNQKIDSCGEILGKDEAASIAERVPDAATNSKEVAKLANNEETKEVANGMLGKFGKALRLFGQAVAVAKVAKFALNKSKGLVDACGGMAVKFKENKDTVAQISLLINNGDDADQKYSDTRFGIYFSADDLKWHATNLDDSKMKIDGEEDLIKRVLDTNTGKEFKKEALANLEKLFDGDNGKTMKYFVNNYKDLGIKADKDVEKMLEKLKNIANNFDEVKKQFA